MNCPKCKAEMTKVSLKETTLDKCTLCKGIWLDAGEAKSIKEDDFKVGKIVDTGLLIDGARMNLFRNIVCPYCETDMKSLTYSKDNRIKYEACESCFGVFMDVGELALFDNQED